MSHARTVKITLVGPSGAGKTALRKRIANQPLELGYQPTRGYDFDLTSLSEADLPADLSSNQAESQLINLQVWEIGGDEQHSYLVERYSRKPALTLITLDANQPLDNLKQQFNHWNNLLDKKAPESQRMVVLQKGDLLQEANDQEKIAAFKAYVKQKGITEVATSSAQTGEIAEVNASLHRQMMAPKAPPVKTQAAQGFLSRVKATLSHPLVVGFVKWVLLPAAIAAAIVFSGGLAAIPVVGAAMGSVGSVAAFGAVTAFISFVGNALNSLRKLCCRPSTAKPAVDGSSVSPAPSPRLSPVNSNEILSGIGGVQHEEKQEETDERTVAKQAQTTVQTAKAKRTFEELVATTEPDTLFSDSGSFYHP
jgi:Ras-related protein Rab-7A